MLPEKVAHRKGKKGPTAALSNAVAREWPRLKPIFDEPRVCAYGYVNHESLMTALERVRHGAEKFSFHLFVTIATEFWLRSLERRSSSTKTITSQARVQQQVQAVALSGP
jgi:hypothetical protein